MAKSKTKLKTEVENLNFVIQQKDKIITALKNTCWDLMNFREKALKENNTYFQTGLFIGLIFGLTLAAALVYFNQY